MSRFGGVSDGRTFGRSTKSDPNQRDARTSSAGRDPDRLCLTVFRPRPHPLHHHELGCNAEIPKFPRPPFVRAPESLKRKCV